MKANKRKIPLPIGRAALLAHQISSLRDECCAAAGKMLRQQPLDEGDLEDCARLDDALAAAQRLLKPAVGGIALSRLNRRRQAK